MERSRIISAEQIELELELKALRRSLDELEASRNFYAFLFDFAPVAYLSFDPDGIIRTVNPTGERLLGIESTELIGRNFDSFVAADERFVFAKFIQAVFACGEKQTCRVRLVNCPSPLSVRIEALATESGAECLAVLVDITEKQRAEQALAESEYNLAKAQEMTHVGSWSVDTISGEVRASTELLRILQLDPDDASQEAFSRVVHPDDLENVMEQLRRGAEFGKSYEIEHRLQLPDGTQRWVYTIVEPQVNSAGKVVRMYGTTQDISERKRAEVELRNKTNELQAIFDSIGDGITVYDHQAQIQHQNLISTQFFPQETQRDRTCRDIFHPEQATDALNCPVERALKGERADSLLVFNQGTERDRYLEVTATPIKDALGEKNRALVFSRDVTDKRLQELHLIQSEKMSSIGVLATGIAHEINNPLTSIAGFAEALQRRFRGAPELQDDLRLSDFPHYLEVIMRESYRCKGIIDHLLSFGRKSEGVAVRVDVNQALEEVLELLRYQPGQQQVEVVRMLSSSLPRVTVDPSRLRLVFMNLLVNAYQALDDGGLVEVTTDRDGDNWIAIVIRDTGCGMPPHVHERIWEPFFTTKEVGHGTGLGLALTYNTIKAFGGDIHSESRVGEGSKFTVLLPVAE